MTRKRRILFAVEAITLAQVVRSAVLANQLDPDHFEVHFASGRFDPLVFGKEPRFRCWPLTTIDPVKAASDLERGKRLYETRVLTRYVDEELALLDEVKPDLVVGDFRLSLSTSAELAGVPCVTLINAYWSPYAERRGFPLPDHPIVDLLGDKLAARYFPQAMPMAFNHFAAPVNAIRKKRGLKEVGSLLEVLTHGDATLYLDVPELVPTGELPRHHGYIGPVQWEPQMVLPPSVARLMRSRDPIVYVTLGSSGRVDRLPDVLAALSTLPVKVVVATAGRAVPAHVPANAVVEPFVPGDAVASKASLVISNGGSTTGYQALARGVPVLGIYSNLDQALATEAIVNAGAGMGIRAGVADAHCIRVGAERLLSSERYREGAQRIARLFAGWDSGHVFDHFVRANLGVTIGRTAA